MITQPIDRKFYNRMRAEGTSPAAIKAKWLEIINQDPLDRMIRVTIATFIGVSIFGMMMKMNFYGGTIWVTSPSGKTTVRLPVMEALRAVRKHDWELTVTYPLRKVGRREALDILIHGDRLATKGG